MRPKEVVALEGVKFRKRGDVVAFAAKHPGALTGFFLAGVHARLSHGVVTETRQLRRASVTQWAGSDSSLNEVRDRREVATLAMAMDHVNRRELAQAMDVLSQRILAIQMAKRKGGSWEKAEVLELLPPAGGALAPPGLAWLTG